MKINLHPYLTAAGFLVAAHASLPAADKAPGPREEKRDVRVLSGPGRFFGPGGEGRKVEMETVTFLGVETSPVSATTSAQLGLARGTGLVVNHLVPDSPAAAALQVHDILLKLDDQILIETRQLAVLVRNHQQGDEVTLTYLRAGQKATAKLKLGQQEVPKVAVFERALPSAGAMAFGADGEGRVELRGPGPDGPEGREEWDRVLSLMQRARPAPDGPPGFVPSAPRIRIDRGGAGPGLRAMSINASNGNLVFSDDEGSLELTIKNGVKTLVAKDAKGAAMYSGPATTPEERGAMPAGVRERLEKLEGMHDVTFRTDGDFKGAPTKTLRPRGIATPAPRRESAPSPVL